MLCPRRCFVVNCAISPLVSLSDWGYEKKSGLGGSGAWVLLNGRDGIEASSTGVGWQDPAIIREQDFVYGEAAKDQYSNSNEMVTYLKALWHYTTPK